MISKIVSLILLYKMSPDLFTTNSISNIVKRTIIQLYVSVKSMITNVWKNLPVWVSKSGLWQSKK